MQEVYEASSTWPNDGVEVSDEVINEFVNSYPPAGKIRGVRDGLPVWEDVTLPSEEDMIASAEYEKNSRITEAVSRSTLLQSKLLLGRISETEKQKLNLWIDYIELLNEIDTSKPSDVTWPEKPE